MDEIHTHDSLYKMYIADQFGPNYLSTIKIFSVLIAFGFILIILLTNLHDAITIKPTNTEEPKSSGLTQATVTIV